MKETRIETFKYENGEIQRVQLVKLDNWAEINFFRPSYSLESYKRVVNLYRNFIVPRCPWVFPQMTLTHTSCGVDYEEKVSGKLLRKKTLPVGNSLGFMSESQKDAFLKVNASFFIMDCFDVVSKYDKIGTPLGLCVKNGEVVNPPLFGREALLVSGDGKVSVRNIDHNEFSVFVGDKRVPGSVYERPFYKKVGRFDKLVIVGREIVDITNDPVTVPASGFVLQTVTDGLKVGDTITYKGFEDCSFGIQVGNSILIDGVPTKEFKSKFYNIKKPFSTAYPPSLYPLDFEKARAPRIALGADREGRPMLAWVEGMGKLKYSPGEDSCGASLLEMVNICESLGFYNAVNLDGGGSAQILINNKRSLMISDRNPDNTEAERAVPMGLIVEQE